MKYFFILFLSSNLFAAADGLEIGVAADLVYEQGINRQSGADDKLTLRSAEIMFEAPVDHQFNAKLSAAAHDENGETVFELHEAILESSKLLPRTRITAGQFFLGVGRLNRFHQHDWPFTKAPKVHESFFDSEGVFDLGLEVKHLLPTQNFYELTLGLTSGYRYGHSHTSGAKPKAPTLYARVARFFDWEAASGAELGLNFLSRTDAQDNQMNLLGLDFVSKWRQGRELTFLVQSELWYKNEENQAKHHQEFIGHYIYAQYGITPRNYLGLRIDTYKELSSTNPLNNRKINNIDYGITSNWTFKNSEFALLRSSLSHEFRRQEGITQNQDTRFQLQLVFIIGAHPAHTF